MSRIEQLRKRLASIHEEANRQEAARKETLRQAEEEKKRELEAEWKEQKLVDKNWSLAKLQVLNFFQELNRDLLDGKGKVVRWEKKKTGNHLHSYEYYAGREGGPHGYNTATYSYWVFGEFAELQVANLGKIVVSRPIKYQKGGCNERDFSPMPGAKSWVYIGIFTSAMKEKVVYMNDERPAYPRELPCPKCENVSKVELTLPLDEITDQLKEVISEKLVILHEETLLK